MLEELLHPTDPPSKHEIEAFIRTTDEEIDFRNERVKTMDSEVLQWEMKLTETEKGNFVVEIKSAMKLNYQAYNVMIGCS